MKNDLVLVKIDFKYCNYLRKFDNKVPYNFDNKKQRPFIGVLFKINEFKYFAPLSSPKSKHIKMKNTLDFLKLDDGKLGAINFNNMIPVKDCNVKLIDLNKVYSEKSKQKYQKLLKEQLYWLNRNDDKLYSKSYKLYSKYIDGSLSSNIKKRCCDFKLLEEKSNEYNEESY